MRARVHIVTCDNAGCTAEAPGALHAVSAIAAAASAGWTRTREHTPEGWFLRDYCPTHTKDPR